MDMKRQLLPDLHCLLEPTCKITKPVTQTRMRVGCEDAVSAETTPKNDS